MNDDTAKEYIKEEMGQRGVRWLTSRYSEWIFAFISFIESVIAPIIIDPFLIALILARRERWIRYIVISIVFSVLGGFVGYLLGLWFFDFIGKHIIDAYGMSGYFETIKEDVNNNSFAFVLLGALTPIPYKLVAIASGLVQVNIWTFLVASIVGRILRLGLVGLATYMLGPRALPLMRKHLFMLVSVIAVILIAYIALKIFFPDFSQAFQIF